MFAQQLINLYYYSRHHLPCSSCLETLSKNTTQRFCKCITAKLLHRGTSHDILVTNRGQVRMEANRLHKMTMQVTSWQGLPARGCKYVHFGGNLAFRSYLSYPNVSFAQCTVLCTDVTFPDDLVAFAHKSHMRMSRLHAQPWQHGILHLLGVKTAGVTHCKQNGYISHAQKMTISIIIL